MQQLKEKIQKVWYWDGVMQLQRIQMVHLFRMEQQMLQTQLTQVHSVLYLRDKLKNMILLLQLKKLL